MNSNGDVLRVDIPVNMHPTIRGIREIAVKHTDDDIYEMLKACNMDPNETAQKLLYVDTFHEVKNKHNKRRANASNRAFERHRWTSGMQQRGARSGRGNNSSIYIFNDAGRRRQLSARPGNGGSIHIERSADVLVPVHHRAQNHAAPHTNSSITPTNGPRSVSNGSSSHEHTPQASPDNITNLVRGNSIAYVNKLDKRPALLTVAVKQLRSSNPGPTPTSTPTTASIVSSGARFDGRISESRSTHLQTSMNSASVSGVYSSASDPVLLPSLNLHNPAAVGTIKRETGSQRSASEFSGSSSESRLNAGQDGSSSSSSQAGAGTINRTSEGVEKSKNSESSRTSSLLSHDKSSTAILKQDGWPLQQVNGSSKVMKTQGGTATLGANLQSLSKLSDSVLEQATSQLDMKLEKLKLSPHQPVIFPDHIQVPEALRNGLTFGSLNDDSGQSKNANKDSTCVDVTVLTNQDATKEPPLRHQTGTTSAQKHDYPGRSQMHPNAFGNLSPLEGNAFSAATPKADQMKPDILPHIGGLQYPFLHTAPDYSFGLVPPILGPHLVQVEATEDGNSPVPSTSGSSQSATQPVGVGQNSVAVSPQLIPFFRQPYPSNYVPYNPYFPQFYMPHSAHQFLGHSGFPQQASTGNIYMPPAAATGVKFPVSSVYKPGTVAGNLAHFGIPSGYNSYGSSAVGYGFGATMTPSSSASNEDLAAPELKEKNIYSTLKQSEESHMWTAAPARDVSTLQGNLFYNFPQGQQVTFSPAHSGQGPITGMYHLTHATGGSTTVQSHPQQSQTIGGSVESMIPPTGTYQQPHSQIHWNTKLLNRENI